MVASSPFLGLRRLAAVAIVGATVAVVGAVPAHASAESSYLRILNQERTSHGLAPLHVNTTLRSVARSWTARMAASGVLRHNPALTTEVRNWRSLGENVGTGSSIRALADAFWASAEHRDNILDPAFSQVGIAVAVANHRLWISVDFRQPLRRTTSARQYPGHLLMRGSRGPAVAYVRGLLGLSAHRYFGVRTHRAVVTFQRQHDVAVDGIVGPITWATLVRARA